MASSSEQHGAHNDELTLEKKKFGNRQRKRNWCEKKKRNQYQGVKIGSEGVVERTLRNSVLVKDLSDNRVERREVVIGEKTKRAIVPGVAGKDVLGPFQVNHEGKESPHDGRVNRVLGAAGKEENKRFLVQLGKPELQEFEVRGCVNCKKFPLQK